jgi:S1-C subfamily serine protease
MDAAAAESTNGFGSQSGTGQAYAIGFDQALSIVEQVKAGEASATVQIGPRAVLGVDVVDTPWASGAYVEAVETGSPAAGAGIVPGDTIVTVGAATISAAADLSNALAGDEPGQSVTVGWVDPSGATHSASVQLTTGPPA